MKLKAYPGCYLVSPIENKDTSTQLTLTSEKKGRILKGKILDVGDPMEQKSGGILKPHLKTGAIIYFLSYEGGYDLITYDNKEYYVVLFEDGRAYE